MNKMLWLFIAILERVEQVLPVHAYYCILGLMIILLIALNFLEQEDLLTIKEFHNRVKSDLYIILKHFIKIKSYSLHKLNI